MKLSRDLSLFSVTMIGVGAMIGAGIFVLTGIAAGVAGPAILIAFLLTPNWEAPCPRQAAAISG
jgi:amino acid transporter